MRKEDAKVGMKVLFGRSNGEKTLAEIVKINRKNIKVKTLEPRGTKKHYPAGSEWGVSPSLCEPTDKKPARSKKVVPSSGRSNRRRKKEKVRRKQANARKYRRLSKKEREDQAAKDAKKVAEDLKSHCDLSNPPTYIKSSRRYLDGTSIRKRGEEYDGQRQKLYDAEDHCTKGEEFETFRDAEKYFEKVLDSAWFNRRFKRPDVTLRRGRGRGSAAYYNGSIRLSVKNHMYERILLHELTHALVPQPHAGHGRLFCAIYLDLVRHYMGEDAYEELLEGYRKEGVKYRPHHTALR